MAAAAVAGLDGGVGWHQHHQQYHAQQAAAAAGPGATAAAAAVGDTAEADGPWSPSQHVAYSSSNAAALPASASVAGAVPDAGAGGPMVAGATAVPGGVCVNLGDVPPAAAAGHFLLHAAASITSQLQPLPGLHHDNPAAAHAAQPAAPVEEQQHYQHRHRQQQQQHGVEQQVQPALSSLWGYSRIIIMVRDSTS